MMSVGSAELATGAEDAMKKFQGFETEITRSDRGGNLRRVFFTFVNVAPPGADWVTDHGGRKFELTSFKGGPVEVYVFNREGLPIYQGTVRRYAPGQELRQAFREIWNQEQTSKAARDAFEASAAEEAF
jgi:hypothetical protein